MKTSQVLGIIFAIALTVFSAVYPVPEKYVDVSSSYSAYDYSWSKNTGAQYLGGDAYNYQVEASLKAGYMGGVLAMKSITFVGGLLLFFLTLYSREKCSAIEKQTCEIAEIAKKYGKILEVIAENSDGQKNILNNLSDALNKRITPTEKMSDDEKT